LNCSRFSLSHSIIFSGSDNLQILSLGWRIPLQMVLHLACWGILLDVIAIWLKMQSFFHFFFFHFHFPFHLHFFFRAKIFLQTLGAMPPSFLDGSMGRAFPGDMYIRKWLPALLSTLGLGNALNNYNAAGLNLCWLEESLIMQIQFKWLCRNLPKFKSQLREVSFIHSFIHSPKTTFCISFCFSFFSFLMNIE